MKRVAFQGEKGAYSEEAIYKHYGNEVETVPRPYLRDVFDTVESGEANYGLVPVENTIEGSIVRAFDLLNERGLKASGEEIHRIQHCLIVHPDANLSNIKRAYSHPQALGQSREYLETNNIEPLNFYDTAGGVKWIKENNVMDAAGIASAQAAETYDMKILVKGIETNTENYTRFLEIGFDEPEPTGRDKTTLAFIVEHRPGSLVRALQEFSDRTVNLEKVESRPRIGKPWEYIFFIDLEGHIRDQNISSALEALQEYTIYIKHLGSYPRA
ncbi:prephenate dehydratase [Thermoproteota archaeon]